MEESKFIYETCKVCEAAEKLTRRYPNHIPKKFLICAGGENAICCECSYRIKIPQLNTMEVKQKMGKLNEEAMAYESPQTKNIADLEVVIVADVDVEDKTGIDKNGKEFAYKVITVDGEEYRVPNSVLKALKAILEVKPDLKAIKVTKTGEGLNTEYTVIPL